MTTTTAQWIQSMNAVEDFVEWINTEADIPTGYRFTVDKPGRKYVRINMEDGQRSVHAFVELATGNLLMPAGYQAPAKHERGNVITGLDEIKDRFDWTGRYLYLR